MIINLKLHQALMQVKIKHISKFNFALVMIKYNMEKPLFLHCSKGI